jgi:hypothetical protein
MFATIQITAVNTCSGGTTSCIGMNAVGYISVEKSEAYSHLESGYFIARAAICNTSEEAEQELLKFKPFARKEYVANTEIYMGRIH